MFEDANVKASRWATSHRGGVRVAPRRDQGFCPLFIPVDMEMSRRSKGGTLFYSCPIRFYFSALHADVEEPEAERLCGGWRRGPLLFCCRKNGNLNEA